MVASVDETRQLGLDSLTALPGARTLLCGWVTRQNELGGSLSIQAGGTNCPILHCGFTAGAPSRLAGAHDDFALVFSLPEDVAAGAMTVTLRRGESQLRLPLDPAAIEADMAKSPAERPKEASFALLRDCATNPDLALLLRHGPNAFGALADWIARLNPVRGKSVENAGTLEEAETLTSSAGEVLVILRAGTAFPASATIEAAAVGLAPATLDEPAQAIAVPLLDWRVDVLPQALVAHGRIDPAWLDRLSLLDLVLQVRPRPEEAHWLRCRPRPATVPDLLDAVCRTTPFAEPTEAAAAEALGLLRLLIARREALFMPLLAGLAAQRGGPDSADRLPRQVLILGADDPVSARLFQVTAAEFEGRADTLLLLGDAAEAVAEVFLRRGRVPVKLRAEALLALREAAGRTGIVAVEAARFADAVGRNRPAEAFSHPLGAVELARLMALHRFAGCEAAMADTLSRLLQRGRPGEAGFAAVRRSWTSRHAAALVTEHLARLWAAGELPRSEARAEALLHA